MSDSTSVTEAESLATTSPEGGNINSRRGFLKLGAGVMTAGAAASLSAVTAVADDFGPNDVDESVVKIRGPKRRANEAYRIRENAATQHLNATNQLGQQLDNDDETRYATDRFYASFTKTLPANEWGEVEPSAFEALQTAMRTGAKADFDALQRDSAAVRGLANPQGAFRYETTGLDSHATRIRPAHTFRSAAIAGEMGEVYWQALTRDIPYSQYSESALIAEAVADLNRFSVPPGGGPALSAATLFRGETLGDAVGPYISQFLWQPFSFGSLDVEQRYEAGFAGTDFMTDHASWLHVQRGGAPYETLAFAAKRYINDNRALSEYVHRDVLYQAYLNAALIGLAYGPAALDAGNPYANGSISGQGGFTSLGAPFVIDLVSVAGNLALSSAWFQKWRVHRLLRPEAYAGRVHFHVTGSRTYELHGDILNSDAVSRVLSRSGGSAFLPMAYPEGSPTHPSYPAGHATIAGACVTVLKACFDESFVIPNPVVADTTGSTLQPYDGDDLTLGGELNKLANNIALGRDAAGVHYRQDGVQGLIAGEQQAIALLQDKSRTLNESDFEGFSLTRFDGSRIRIKDGDITSA